MTDTRSAMSPPRDHLDLTPGAAAGSDARTMVLVVYGLYLAGFVTGGLTTLIGLVMAYVGRGSAPAWAESHYSFQIRTFWLTVLAMLLMGVYAALSTVLVLALIGIPMLLLLAPIGLALMVWFGVRCAVGLGHALSSREYPDPTTLLI